MSYVPDPWPFVLLALASWRVWLLIADDKITDKVMDWLLRKTPDPTFWREFVECPRCFGAWVALAWWGAWMLWPHATLIVAALFAIFAVVALLESVHSAISK